jgi:glucose-1-phosphate adenylyltransferase
MVVPMSEIHQFGAGIIDNENRIIDWEEKPENPKTNLASMGIYVFDYKYLLDSLYKDKAEVDFGMHILPRAIAEDNVFAYPFYGYWRDVGTVQSYWEANMDVIRRDSPLSPEAWGIRSNIEADVLPADRAPARFGSNAKISSSMISAGCNIRGTVENSVLAPGVVIEEGAVIRDSILFADCVVGKNSTVDLAIFDKRVQLEGDAQVGVGSNHSIPNIDNPTHLYTGISLLGKGAYVPSGVSIGRNCIINSQTTSSAYPGKTVEDGHSV